MRRIFRAIIEFLTGAADPGPVEPIPAPEVPESFTREQWVTRRWVEEIARLRTDGPPLPPLEPLTEAERAEVDAPSYGPEDEP